MSEKVRLDVLVQERAGVTRSKAQGLIRMGHVLDAKGEKLQKPGERFDDDVSLEILEGPRYVSRGGDKLEGALKGFDLDVSGVIALDAGASTGGFTDCLLQHGAAKVYAVDVGYGQLAWSMRQDPRVVVMERCNIRHLTPDQIEDAPDFFVIDCSFISLNTILPPIVALLGENPRGVALIKPQFEAGRDQVGKGGVVRDSRVHERVVESVVETATSLGFREIDVIPSPLLGPAGNKEFLAYLRDFRPA